jgi:hypothetical protein
MWGNFEATNYGWHPAYPEGAVPLCIPNHVGYSSEIDMAFNAGGALPDISWLEAGDAPMIAFHCVRDAFAPFTEGTVIVPTTNKPVVDVQGANLYIQKANALGNNDAIKGIKANDPYTMAAEANYGATVAYIYDSPADEITINTEVTGLFPVLLPIAEEVLNNQSSPWQWWDPTSPYATADVSGGAGFTAHMNSIQSNPDMSPEKGRTYLDTILGYMCPRVALINGDITMESLSVNQTLPATAAAVYPNPATSEVTIRVDAKYTVTSISITDITGREVLVANAKNTVSLNLETIKAGYYIVNVQTNAGTISTKLIKE